MVISYFILHISVRLRVDVQNVYFVHCPFPPDMIVEWLVPYLETSEEKRTVLWLFDVCDLYDDSLTGLVTGSSATEIHRQQK